MSPTPQSAKHESGSQDRSGAAPADSVESTDDLPVLPDLFDPDDDSQSWTGRDLLLLLGVTLVAAAARLFGLGEWSMWVDEVHTVRDATMPLSSFWGSNVATYPAASLLVRVLYDQYASFEPGWLRLPFVFAGILTIPLLAIVGRSIIGRRAALAGALFLALSPWHIYWSQSVRGYSLLMLFGVASIGMFWTGIQRRSWLAYTVSLLLLVAAGATHPTGYAIGGIYAIVTFLLLWSKPGVYRTGVLVWTILLAVGLVFGGYLLLQEQLQWFLAAKGNPSPVHLLQTVAFFFRLTLLAAAIGAFFALRRGRDHGPVVFVGLWVAIPIAAVFALSLFAQTTAQYSLTALPAICLLAGALCAEVARKLESAQVRSRILRLALPAILVADLVSYDTLYLTRQHGDRPQWREAANFVLEQSHDASIVLTTNQPSMQFYLQPEVFRGMPSDAGRIQVHGLETWDMDRAGGGDNLLRDWQRRASHDSRGLFVVITVPEFVEKDPRGAADRWLRANARQVLRLPTWAGPKDMTVLVYEVPGDSDDR